MNKFAKKDASSSINDDEGFDTQPLLIGDSNEENRLKATMEEKKQASVNGKLSRLTANEIEEKEKLLGGRAGSTGSKGTMKGFTPSSSKVNPKLKKALMIEEQEKVEKAKRQADDQRKREAIRFSNSLGKKAARNIMMPKYKRDPELDVDREIDQPPESLFVGLGWDEDATTLRKHYRRFYP